MNVRFEGDTATGWVCELPFPDQYHPTVVFTGARAATTDEAYGNLLDAMAFELAELREIVRMATG